MRERLVDVDASFGIDARQSADEVDCSRVGLVMRGRERLAPRPRRLRAEARDVGARLLAAYARDHLKCRRPADDDRRRRRRSLTSAGGEPR